MNVKHSIFLTHEVQMDDQANLTLTPFGIACLAGLVFYPPSSYIVPPSFVVGPPFSVFSPAFSVFAL